MRLASLFLKALSFRIGRLSELRLGPLPVLLRLFGSLNCRDMAPNGISLIPFSLSSGYARLMLKLRKESPSCHDTHPFCFWPIAGIAHEHYLAFAAA
jgi:hypothetical protein